MTNREHLCAVLGLAGGVLAFVIVLLAAPPPAADGRFVAIFPPWMSEERAFSAVVGSGSLPIGARGGGLVWEVEAPKGGGRKLKTLGALVVLGGHWLSPPLGCVTLAQRGEGDAESASQQEALSARMLSMSPAW